MVLPEEQLSIIRRGSQRMLAKRLEIVEGLKKLPALVAEEAKGLNEEQLCWRPREDQWSIKEVCAHLRDYAEISDRRLFMILTQTTPLLPAINPAWVRERGYQEQNIAEILKAYRVARARTIDRIEYMPDAIWSRAGYHPEAGLMSIRQLTERMLAHERDHLDQIRAVKAQLREHQRSG